ncbi:uncharacterized protein BDR25DRAFT_84423 [Lindgomyces ingoldianus]|uniref:Uncharacterized protein n=1 Tax=Lindgomyces ingoldianus TaxID=673940 RepID=A0ACB6QGK4_9PLEO|nr:uncharacterized protein BDR25DRAFT_84423 [Lindgomyces ingoldianus]KAF2465492.1 hypothetical protein BDR25DRAFT_84423 [Lindgomyces ingoldianus]
MTTTISTTVTEVIGSEAPVSIPSSAVTETTSTDALPPLPVHTSNPPPLPLSTENPTSASASTTYNTKTGPTKPVLPPSPPPPSDPQPADSPDCKDGRSATLRIQTYSSTNQLALITSCKDPRCVTALPEVVSSGRQTTSTLAVFEEPTSPFRCFKGAPDPSDSGPVSMPTSRSSTAKNKRTIAIPIPEDFDDQPPRRINKFIVDQMVIAQLHGNIIPIAGNGDSPVGGISSGIHGGSSVMVIAQRTIWIAYFWEIPIFSNEGSVRMATSTIVLPPLQMLYFALMCSTSLGSGTLHSAVRARNLS